MPSHPPTAFLSYSYDNDAHVEWVLTIAHALMSRGINVKLDKWDLSPGHDLAHFMESGVSGSDWVVLVCSESYVRKANAGTGGVGYEKLIITKGIISDVTTQKFVPILKGNSAGTTPLCLGPRKFVDFRSDANYPRALEELVRTLHRTPKHVRPALGASPYSKEESSAGRARRRAQTLLVKGKRAFEVALNGVSPFEFQPHGTCEIAVTVQPQIEGYSTNQNFLDEVFSRKTRYLSWPAFGDSRNAADSTRRPYVMMQGWECLFVAGPPRTSHHLDFWRIEPDGNFYLRRGLKDDLSSASRAPAPQTALDFAVVIAQLTEAIAVMTDFARALVAQEDQRIIGIAVRWHGLAGRELASWVYPEREICPGQRCRQNGLLSSTEVPLTPLRTQSVLEPVVSLAGTLFNLFDGFELERSVYEDIVRKTLTGILR